MAEPLDPPPAPDDANPFAAPRSRGGVPEIGLDMPENGPVNGGLVRHVMPVAILMIIQGVLELLLGIVYMGLIVFVPMLMRDMPAGQGMPPPATFESILMITYGVMGGDGLIAGVLHVVAGIYGLRYRRRMLGIVALAAGMLGASTIYCAPTAIGLAIYGLITYCNPAVVAAFALGDAGVPPAGVRARFGA